MSTVEMHALRPEHLKGFRSMGPTASIPDTQWGEAIAFIRDGEVLGVLGGWHNEDVVELGLLLSTEARRYPVSMHRTARAFLAYMDRTGWHLRAWPQNHDGARWLRRLGFEAVNSGAFERCPNRQPC